MEDEDTRRLLHAKLTTKGAHKGALVSEGFDGKRGDDKGRIGGIIEKTHPPPLTGGAALPDHLQALVSARSPLLPLRPPGASSPKHQLIDTLSRDAHLFWGAGLLTTL